MFLKINFLKIIWDKSYFSRASKKVILKTEAGLFISFTEEEVKHLYKLIKE